MEIEEENLISSMKVPNDELSISREMD